MAGERNPAVLRRRLRTELRRARSTSGLTQRDAATGLDWSPSKLIRIENGSVGVTPVDLRALLSLYGVTDSGWIESLVEMARASKRPGWSEYRDVLSREFLIYLENEASASIIRQTEPLLVPGLLQTEEYSRAWLRSGNLGRESAKFIDRAWEVRASRQEIFDQPDRPEMIFILDEAAVRRHVGGASIMRRQLEFLKSVVTSGQVEIAVIPFSAGAHQGLRGPFTILEFAEPEDDPVLYFENSLGDTVTRDDTDLTSQYLTNFLELQEIAVQGADFLTLIDRTIAGMAGGAGGADVAVPHPLSAEATGSITGSQ